MSKMSGPFYIATPYIKMNKTSLAVCKIGSQIELIIDCIREEEEYKGNLSTSLLRMMGVI